MNDLEVIEGKAVEIVRLGTLQATSPDDVVAIATGMAKTLANIINSRKLYTVISGRKYVRVEGWTTLGAMLGILPREVEVVEQENGDFLATVELIRASDGVVIGRASSIVSSDEKLWKMRERYARRSMAVTRATGKAYRLGFSWIIALAGYEPTPAEEMPQGDEKYGVEPEFEGEPQAKSEPEPKPVKHDFAKRPYDADTLRAAIAKKAKACKDATEKQVQLAGMMLAQFFGDDAKCKEVKRYLFGVTSLKEADQKAVTALLNWMNLKQDSGGAYAIDDMATTELGKVLDAAAIEAGQTPLFDNGSI